jgi:hypothetical protein
VLCDNVTLPVLMITELRTAVVFEAPCSARFPPEINNLLSAIELVTSPATVKLPPLTVTLVKVEVNDTLPSRLTLPESTCTDDVASDS